MTALDGVIVIDLTQYEAGPSCTLNLAWLGADVIKVEPPKGEPARRNFNATVLQRLEKENRAAYEKALAEANQDTFYYLINNANKRSIPLDLRSETGAELLLQLVAKADVFVENFAPGTIERLGFGYEELRKINPRIIYGQVKGFDRDGPYGKFLAFNNVAQPAAGIMSVTGPPSGPPMMAGFSVGDTAAGLHLALGILGALYQRESTGVGQLVRVSMQEALISMCRVHHGYTVQSGEPAQRRGNGYAVNNAPADIYPCPPFGPNDFISIYTSRAVDSHHWDRLLDVIGRPELKNEERFSSSDLRSEHAEEIDALINEWSAKHDKREAMMILQEAGVPAAAVFDMLELEQDEHLQNNGTFVTVDHPQRGSFLMCGSAMRMSDSEVEVVAAPLLGEHTREVLGNLLGLDEDEISKLVADGVTTEPALTGKPA